jgi:hypothetical protein
MSAGKGDSPRNMGPKFRENFDRIFSKATRCTKGTEAKGASKPNSLEPKPLAPAPHSPRTVPPYPHE